MNDLEQITEKSLSELTFNDLQLSENTLKALETMGFTTPSPIQAQAIPLLLEGNDVIGQAQTGTGKTAAFGVPLIELLDPNSRDVQGLIVCPTRELALQVTDEIKKIAQFKKGFYITTVYGGDSIDRQIRALRGGSNIVVGTPGRIQDMMERGALKLENVKMVILDEADEMLDMGFRDDIEIILKQTPKNRQTVLFSATMSKPIMGIAQKYLNQPKLVKVVKKELTNANIEQLYFEIRPEAKAEVLGRLIDFYDIKLSLVFCNQKRMVDEVVEQLTLKGYAAEGLHGDLRQSQRNQVMARFRSGHVNVLVATDVAARGIDVDNVDAVINYDLPLDEEYYVHRIGRTARAGKFGKAFSFVTGSKERHRLGDIMAYTKVVVEKAVIPSAKDIIEKKKMRFVEQIEKQAHKKETANFSELWGTLEERGLTPTQAVGALAQLFLGSSLHSYSNDESLVLENRPRKGRDSFDEKDRKFGRNDRNDSRERGNWRERGESSFGERRDFKSGKSSSSNTNRPSGIPTGMTRLFINIGKIDDVQPRNIVGAIAGEAQVAGNELGQIDIFDKYSFINVPQKMASTIINRMEGATIKGKRVAIEEAN